MKTVSIPLFRWPSKDVAHEFDLMHAARQLTSQVLLVAQSSEQEGLHVSCRIGLGRCAESLHDKLFPFLKESWSLTEDQISLESNPLKTASLNFSLVPNVMRMRSWFFKNEPTHQILGTGLIVSDLFHLNLAQRLEKDDPARPMALREPDQCKQTTYTLDCTESEFQTAGRMALEDYSPMLLLPPTWAAIPALVYAMKPSSHGYQAMYSRSEEVKRYLTSPR